MALTESLKKQFEFLATWPREELVKWHQDRLGLNNLAVLTALHVLLTAHNSNELGHVATLECVLAILGYQPHSQEEIATFSSIREALYLVDFFIKWQKQNERDDGREKGMYHFVAKTHGATIMGGPRQPDLLIPSCSDFSDCPQGVPIECKAGPITENAVYQLLRYMHQFEAKRGILIGTSLDKRAKLMPGMEYHQWTNEAKGSDRVWIDTGERIHRTTFR